MCSKIANGWDPTHIRFYNPKQLCQLLMNAGFYQVKIVGTYFIPYMMSLWFRKIHKNFQRLHITSYGN